MPSLTKVQQMLAAGWQGNGAFRLMMPCDSAPQASSAASSLRCMYSRRLPEDAGFDRYIEDVPAWSLAGLADLGVPGSVLDLLRVLVDGGADEDTVCLLALHDLLHRGVKLSLDRERARDVRRTANGLAGFHPDLSREVASAVTAALGSNP